MAAKPKSPRILVTGAAGYLGRCTLKKLSENGFPTIGIDNYSTSQRRPVPGFEIVEADLADLSAATRAWRAIGGDEGRIDGVIHFAAKALVPESCEKPYEYFHNNVLSTLNLAELCRRAGVRQLVHSSTCAVYGVPERLPIEEHESLKPISPYGETKRANEEVLAAFAKFQGLHVVNLRYFNPAGALDREHFGERHEPETHLIPNVVRAALAKQTVSVYGNDYETTDGTCVRDFFHVGDLADAHVAALQYTRSLPSGPTGSVVAVNLGSGTGHSVLSVLRATERILGHKIDISFQPRRPGDPPRLVASTHLAAKLLHWKPKLGLEDILASEIEWQRAACHAQSPTA